MSADREPNPSDDPTTEVVQDAEGTPLGGQAAWDATDIDVEHGSPSGPDPMAGPGPSG
jgi:hypothetical protein